MTPWVPQQRTYFLFKKSLSHLAWGSHPCGWGLHCSHPRTTFQDPLPTVTFWRQLWNRYGVSRHMGPEGHLPECASTPDLPVQVTGN